ncbi:hypothetical protein D3C78_1096540 [compost metagenome]
MDLITADRRLLHRRGTRDPTQLLVRLQHGDEIEQAQAIAAAGRAFQPQRVFHPLAEHLQAATNTQHLAAVTQMPGDGLIPATGAQLRQIAAHALGTRQDDQVRRRNRIAWADELQVDLRVQAQRVEIGMVADARQHRHDHFECARGLVTLALVDTVLGFQVQVHHIRQHAQYRFAGARLKPVQTRLQ